MTWSQRRLTDGRYDSRLISIRTSAFLGQQRKVGRLIHAHVSWPEYSVASSTPALVYAGTCPSSRNRLVTGLDPTLQNG